MFTSKLSRCNYLFIIFLFGGDVDVCPGTENAQPESYNARGLRLRGIQSNFFEYQKLTSRMEIPVTIVICIHYPITPLKSEIEQLEQVEVLEYI